MVKRSEVLGEGRIGRLWRWVALCISLLHLHGFSAIDPAAHCSSVTFADRPLKATSSGSRHRRVLALTTPLLARFFFHRPPLSDQATHFQSHYSPTTMSEQTPEKVLAAVPSERHFLIFIASHEERGRPWCR